MKNKHSYIRLLLLPLTILLTSFMQLPHNTKPALHYLVRSPKIKIDTPPLLLLLHGVGSNEQDLFSFANSLPDKFLVVSVRGPLTLGPGSYAWFHVDFSTGKPVINPQEAESARKALIQFIEDLKKAENFDEKSVYLMGFSQGGIMSYSTALTVPEKIAGIAVMSGRLLPEIKPAVADNKRLANLKVYISHGERDNVLPFQNALDATEYLKTKGISSEFHKYPDAHTISEAMFRDVNKWFAECIKNKH